MKCVRPAALQPGEDLVDPLERGALLTVLQPMQGRGGNTQFPGESLERGLAPALAQELGELPVELGHSGILLAQSFRMRNMFPCWRGIP